MDVDVLGFDADGGWRGNGGGGIERWEALETATMRSMEARQWLGSLNE